jgi:hypothetical protein
VLFEDSFDNGQIQAAAFFVGIELMKHLKNFIQVQVLYPDSGNDDEGFFDSEFHYFLLS